MMTILLDDDEHKHPTFHNITEAFKALSEQSQPGDAVFIQFSGHGGRVLDAPDDAEAESYDEVIAPSDYKNNGLIRDTLIFKTLLAPMRYGVTVTILFDACDTGVMLDLPYAWSTRADRPGSVVKMTQNDDFSFVRFLKVVKTLYESSTFTQLGRTVGSALHQPQPGPKGPDEADTCDYTDSSRNGDDENTRTEAQANAEPSFMNMFAECGSPEDEEIDKEETKEKKPKKKNRDTGTVCTRDSRISSSLLEQVMNCTLGQEADEVSDEDTYKSQGSYDDNDFGDSTFDSMTDDENESSKRGNRGRSRRRKQN
jgi:hypothetical protein